MNFFYLPVTNICEDISAGLNKPVEKTFNSMKESLIEENNKIVGGDYNGFRRYAEFYSVGLLGNERYRLPLLDESLEPKFAEMDNFITESKEVIRTVTQFLKKLMFFALDSSEDRGEIDLGEVLPSKILSISTLKYDPNIKWKVPENLKQDWEKYDPLVNRLLALRIIL